MANDPAVDFFLRSSLTALWLVSAVEKLRRWPQFVRIVGEYRLLSVATAPWLAASALATELITALALLVPETARAGAATSAGLLLFYSALIARELASDRRQHGCGCLGRAGERALHWGLVVRNLVLAAVATACLLPVAARAWTWLDTVTILAALPIAALLYAAADQLLALPSATPRRLPSPALAPSENRHG